MVAGDDLPIGGRKSDGVLVGDGVSGEPGAFGMRGITIGVDITADGCVGAGGLEAAAAVEGARIGGAAEISISPSDEPPILLAPLPLTP